MEEKSPATPKLYEVVAQANLPANVKVPFRTIAGFAWSSTEQTIARMTAEQLEELKQDKHVIIATVDGKPYAREKDRSQPTAAIKAEAGFQPDTRKAIVERDDEIAALRKQVADLSAVVEELRARTAPRTASKPESVRA
jgi:hypothetical protein